MQEDIFLCGGASDSWPDLRLKVPALVKLSTSTCVDT